MYSKIKIIDRNLNRVSFVATRDFDRKKFIYLLRMSSSKPQNHKFSIIITTIPMKLLLNDIIIIQKKVFFIQILKFEMNENGARIKKKRFS